MTYRPAHAHVHVLAAQRRHRGHRGDRGHRADGERRGPGDAIPRGAGAPACGRGAVRGPRLLPRRPRPGTGRRASASTSTSTNIALHTARTTRGQGFDRLVDAAVARGAAALGPALLPEHRAVRGRRLAVAARQPERRVRREQRVPPAHLLEKKGVMFFGWVFFLISPAHPHVRPMGRTCG